MGEKKNSEIKTCIIEKNENCDKLQLQEIRQNYEMWTQKLQNKTCIIYFFFGGNKNTRYKKKAKSHTKKNIIVKYKEFRKKGKIARFKNSSGKKSELRKIFF